MSLSWWTSKGSSVSSPGHDGPAASTSFYVDQYQLRTEFYILQNLHPVEKSLGKYLAKETTKAKSLQQNCVCEEKIAHNSKEDRVSNRKLKSNNVSTTVSPKKQETWRDHNHKLWTFGEESGGDEEL